MGAIFKFDISTEGLPRWFVMLTKIALIPVVAWPIVFFGSIFMFDNPQNTGLTFFYFLLINVYPLYIIKIRMLSIKYFKKDKTTGIFILSVLFALYILLIIYIYNI